jgi:hypothetical protein
LPATDHPTFRKPTNVNIPIWRYMSLAKFLWLLQNSALYFSRSDKMDDPFEGYFTRRTIDKTVEDAFVRALLDAPHMTFDPSEPDPEKKARDVFRLVHDAALKMRPDLYLNCWHMNEEESLAMWKLYAAHQDSLCIRSTYQRLFEVLPTECLVGEVNYIDYNKSFIAWGNSLNYIVHKRHSFAHERELRAVIWRGTPENRPPPETSGLTIQVDLNAFVDAVYLSPVSDPLLESVVNGLIKSFGLKATLHKSRVNDPPDYGLP